MKKLLVCITVFAVIGLLVTGCPTGGGTTKKEITSVTLTVAGFSQKPTNLRPGNQVGLVVNVAFKGKIDATYEITATEGAGAVTIGVDGSGKDYLLVKTDTASGTSVKVKATSIADPTKSSDEWSFVVSGTPVAEGTEADPTDPSFTASGVTGIILKIDGAAPPSSLTAPADKTVTVEITTTGTGIATTSSLAIVDETGTNVTAGKVTLNTTTGKLLILNDADDNASFKITATSDGDIAGGAPDEKAIVSATITVSATSGGSAYSWKIVNTKGWNKTLNAKTTATVPVAANKRYTVVNNEPGAEIDSQAGMAADATYTSIRFRDVTIMYLDHPFIYDDWQPGQEYGIEARMRIKEHRDSAPVFGSESGQSWASGRQGVLMAAIAGNPEELATKLTFDANGLNTYTIDEVPSFAAWRILSSGQRRAYGVRGYNTAGTTAEAAYAIGSESIAGGKTFTLPNGNPSTYAAELMKHDYADGGNNYDKTKIEGFMDQEFVYSLKRESAIGYNMRLLGSNYETGEGATGGLIDDMNYRRGTDKMRSGSPIYLCFIVYGVTAEISDIKIYENNDVLWIDSAVADATPSPAVAKRVDITATPASPAGDATADYVQVADQFPATGVILSADVVPYSLANRSVSWSINGPSVEGTENAGMFYTGRITGGTGISTVTATPAAGGVNGTYVFNLLGQAVDPQTVVINTTTMPASLFFGESYTFSAVVGPAGAPQDITWSVTPAGAATIDSAGMLTAGQVLVDTPVVITAMATGFAAYGTAELIIKAPAAYFSRVWTFGAASGLGSESPKGDAAWTDQNSGNPNSTDYDFGNGLKLTPPSSGARWDSSQDSGGELAGLYKGIYQGGGVGNLFVLDVSGETAITNAIKVSVVFTATGNNPTAGRGGQLKLSDGTVLVYHTSVGHNPTDGTAANTLANATISWIVDKNQPVVFASPTGGSMRVWEVKVEEVQTRNWTFGAASGLGSESPKGNAAWTDQNSGNPNSTDYDFGNGLKLTPPSSGARWDSSQDSGGGLAGLYKGIYQGGGVGNLFVLDMTDEAEIGAIRVSVVFTATGNNPTAGRGGKLTTADSVDRDPPSTIPNLVEESIFQISVGHNPTDGTAANTLENATITGISSKNIPVIFSSPTGGSMRVWEVIVEF